MWSDNEPIVLKFGAGVWIHYHSYSGYSSCCCCHRSISSCAAYMWSTSLLFFLFLFFSLFLSCLIALSLSEQYHCPYILHKVFCLSPHIFLLCEWYSTITDNKGNTFQKIFLKSLWVKVHPTQKCTPQSNLGRLFDLRINRIKFYSFWYIDNLEWGNLNPECFCWKHQELLVKVQA